MTDAKFLSTMTLSQLEEILKSDDPETKAPLMQERVACLNEVGLKLLEKYDGDFKNVVEAAKGSAEKLLEIIVTDFPCFRDEAEFHGQQVCIYKRAQILIGDICEFQHELEKLNEFIKYFFQMLRHVARDWVPSMIWRIQSQCLQTIEFHKS